MFSVSIKSKPVKYNRKSKRINQQVVCCEKPKNNSKNELIENKKNELFGDTNLNISNTQKLIEKYFDFFKEIQKKSEIVVVVAKEEDSILK